MRWFFSLGTPVRLDLPPGTVGSNDGPDGRPGCTIGGLYAPNEAGWLGLGPGSWIHPDDGNPGPALRLHSLLEQTSIARVPIGHPSTVSDCVWLVPRLLICDAGGFRSAVPRVWSEKGWADPPGLRGLLHELRAWIAVAQQDARNQAAIAAALAAGQTPPDLRTDAADAPGVQVAARILNAAYHLTMHDLVTLGWLDELTVARVLSAATGAQLDD